MGRLVPDLVRVFARPLLRAPEGLVRALVGPPVVREGRTLDRQAQVLLAVLAKRPAKPYWAQTIEEARAGFRATVALANPPPRTMARVVDEVADLGASHARVRIYSATHDEAARPAVVYFHGGGYVLGDLDTVDAACRAMAVRMGVVVVNASYRRAPEHAMPIAAEDGHRAFQWVRANASRLGIDAERIAVAGDSAGGGVAAAVCLIARDAGRPMPAAQLLFYPVTDTRPTSTRAAFATGFLLETEVIDWFQAQYVRKGDEDDFRVAMLRAETLKGLPPAIVVTAGFDPLREEGEAYAARLAASSVVTEYVEAKGLIHGFATMDLLDEGVRVFEDACDRLLRVLER